MTLRALASLVAAAALVLLGVGARAQDTPFGGAAEVVLELREGMTLVDAGRPVAAGRAAYVAEGAGPADADASAVAADAEGRVRLPPRDGATILAWAPGKAPYALAVRTSVPVRVPLADGVVCEVRVTTPSGSPIPDADVSADVQVAVANAADGGPATHTWTVAARTDAAGRALLSDLPDVPLRVRAQREGFVAAHAWPVDPRRGVTLVLGRGARVAGTLRLFPGAQPAEGAVARLGDCATTVAADGSFAFDLVPPGPWTLTFAGTGFVPPPPRTLVLDEGRDRVGVDVTAPRTSSLPGRVSTPEGRPIPGLRLVVEYPPGSVVEGVQERFVGVRPDGTFEAKDLPPCDGCALVVASPGFVTARVLGLSLPAGEPAREVEVHLAPGATFLGRVVGTDDAPVADAVVAVAADVQGAREWTRARTDAAGGFTADGIGPGDAFVKVVGRPVGSDMVFGPFPAAAGESLDLGTLRAFAGWPLAGRAYGAPDGVAVVVTARGRVVARTRVAQEAFDVAGLPSGRVEVRLEEDGGVVGETTATLPASFPVTVRYEAPVTVRGRVVDATGRAVVAATVRAERVDGDGAHEAEVRDPEGGFELRLVPGRWRVEAEDGGGASALRELVLPTDAGRELVLALEPGATLRGTVVRGTAPLEGALVRASVAGDRPSRGVARTDAEGRFRLTGVPAGVVRLRIETPEASVFERPPLVVRERDELDVGVVELPRGTRLRGEVSGPAGQPLARGEVELDAEGGTRRVAATDAWGRFEMDALPPGAAVLRVRDEGGALLRSLAVQVPWTFDDWRLRVDVGAGTRVFGRVTTGARPEPFAAVTLRLDEPAAEVAAVADAEGRYALPPVAAGAGEIEVTVAGARTPWRRAVRVAGGAEQTIDVALPESAVRGVVTASDGGYFVALARVELRRVADGELVAAAVSDEVGEFHLLRVDPGTYDLVATKFGFGPAWVRGIAVGRGSDVEGVAAVLPPEGRVVLRAVDARARPLSTAWASAWRDDGEEDELTGPEVSGDADAEGRIVLGGLSRGAWRVVLGAPGRGRLDLGWVQVEEGERDLGGFQLGRGSLLRVVALQDGPRPFRLAGVEVDVLDAAGGDPRPARRDDPLRGPDPLHVTDAQGVLEVPGLAPGAYRIRPGGREDAEVRVVVREGQVVETFVLVPPEPPVAEEAEGETPAETR